MGIVAANSVARVTLVYTGTMGQEIQNTFHCHNSGLYGTPATLISLATAVAALWDDTAFRDTINANMVLREVRARGVGFGVPTPAVVAVGLAGTHGSSVSLPMNVTVAVKLTTDVGSKAGRGRVYHPGLCVNQVSSDTLASGVAAAIKAAWDHVLPITGYADGSIPGVASFVSGGTPRDEPFFSNLQAITVDNVIDSQRRRLLGRGR